MDRPILTFAEATTRLGQAAGAFESLAGQIRYHYELDEIWQAGNLSHKHHSNLLFKRGGKTQITLCLREDYFIACVVLGKDEREKFDTERGNFSAAVQSEYDNTEVLHDGKWLGFNIKDETLVDDLFKLIQLKSKPNRKVFPAGIEKCGRLDIGLSKQEITNIIMGV